MRTIFKILLSMIIFSLISTPVYAGELRQAGFKLEEDSMVFTIKESQEMAKYISSLEQTIQQNNELLTLKDELLENRSQQILSFEEYRQLQEKQILKYQEIVKLDESRIKQLEKQNKIRKLENIAAFVGGVAVTVTLIIIADRLDDYIIENNPSTNNARAIVRF